MTRTLIAPLAVFAVLAFAGCSSTEDDATEAGPPVASSTTSLCDEEPIYATPDLQAALGRVALPDGATIAQEQSVPNIADPSRIDVIIRVCAPGVVGDQLRDVGTVIARAIKQSPQSDQVATLSVTNLREIDNPLGRVSVGDFAAHTFDENVAPEEAREAWEGPYVG